MKKLFPLSWIPLALVSGAQIAHADFSGDWKKMLPIQPEGYVCGRVSEPLVIDGKLDEKAWKKAPWTRDFQDIEGSPTPIHRTRARMLWDENFFYIAAELKEPHVWGSITNHDAVIFQDPDFEVFLDPKGSRHHYFEFEMNALNTGWDLLLKKPYIDGGPALNEWEIPGLKTAVQIQGSLNQPSTKDKGWTVEIAIPWKALGQNGTPGLAPVDGETWRVDFSRVNWQVQVVDGKYQKVPKTKEYNWVWSPIGIIDMHRPEKWGYVQFTTNAPSSKLKIKTDAQAGTRDVLMGVYYLQKDYKDKTKAWAKSLKELGLATDDQRLQGLTVELSPTSEGYRATIATPTGSPGMKWHIREDGLLRSDNNE